MFLPSPHFNLTELEPTFNSSSTGGYGGRARVVTRIGMLNAPTPTAFTACTRTLQRQPFGGSLSATTRASMYQIFVGRNMPRASWWHADDNCWMTPSSTNCTTAVTQQTNGKPEPETMPDLKTAGILQHLWFLNDCGWPMEANPQWWSNWMPFHLGCPGHHVHHPNHFYSGCSYRCNSANFSWLGKGSEVQWTAFSMAWIIHYVIIGHWLMWNNRVNETKTRY